MQDSTPENIVCPIVGSPMELNESMLPTALDILQYCSFLNSKYSSVSPNSIMEIVLKDVVAKLSKIWKSAGITTVSEQRIKYLLRRLHKERRNLGKSFRLINMNTSTDTYNVKLNKFKNRIAKLFDIAKCKCRIAEKCYCQKGVKGTNLSRNFLEDQRTTRSFVIPLSPETSTVSNDQTTIANRSKPPKRRVLKRKNVELDSAEHVDSKKRKRYNTTKINNLALVLDRYGVEDRAGAAIASATLQDYGIVDVALNKTDQVIDKNKVRRAKDKLRFALNNNLDSSIKGLFFDGRKDQKTLSVVDGRNKRSTESHYTLLTVPGYEYLGHTSPESGHAFEILRSFNEFFQLKGISLKDLLIIGGDGTNVNIGWFGGLIALLEEQLQRPLQWMICQLHGNELPLRHLMQELDGSTDGPETFSGEIGKSLKNCMEQEVVKFKALRCELPPVDKDNLSTDQRYLLDMCNAISSGICSESLSKRQPGKLGHSRWLTFANRVLRKYVSTEKPSQSLITLTTFVLKVYAPLWFTIKTQPSCINGAKHVFKQIDLIRYLPAKLKTIVQDVVQRNSYFAHPENILLTMLGDERKPVRKLAFTRIVKHRATKKSRAVRSFKVPTLRFNATDYLDIINWKGVSCEPPITSRMSEEDLAAIVDNPTNYRNELKEIYCHTQPVERGVKMVTEASSIIANVEKRDGAIRAKILSRKYMPQFDCKKHFNVNA